LIIDGFLARVLIRTLASTIRQIASLPGSRLTLAATGRVAQRSRLR
jgi:hypothetical protein